MLYAEFYFPGKTVTSFRTCSPTRLLRYHGNTLLKMQTIHKTAFVRKCVKVCT